MTKNGEQSLCNEIKLLIRSGIDKDLSNAKKVFSRIQPDISRSIISSALSEIVSGAKVIQPKDNIYLLDSHSGYGMANLQKINSAIIKVCKILKETAPTVLVWISDTRFTAPVSESLPNGFGFVFLNEKFIDEKSLIHEVAHCVLRCGYGFFDEGIAMHCERCVEKRTGDMRLITQTVPLRLLFLSDELSVFLDEFSDLERTAIYEAAARLIDWMIKEGGIEKFKDFIHMLGKVSLTVKIDNHFENTYNTKVEKLYGKLCIVDDESRALDIISNQDLLSLYLEVTRAMIPGETNRASYFFEALKEIDTRECRDTYFLETVKLRVLTLKLFDGNNIHNREISNVWKKEALFYISEKKFSLDSFLLQLNIALLDLINSTDIYVELESVKLRELFSKAKTYYPDSVELCAFGAKLMSHDPMYSNLDALNVLHDAEDREEYRIEVKELENMLRPNER